MGTTHHPAADFSMVLGRVPTKTFVLITMGTLVFSACLLNLMYVMSMPCKAVAAEPSQQVTTQQQEAAGFHQQLHHHQQQLPPAQCEPCKQERITRGEEIQNFLIHAKKNFPVTDKVTSHSYHLMYGNLLSRLAYVPIKMLEIGLGCNMQYGAGASVNLWKSYLHKDSSIWMAEVDAACVEKQRTHASMKGINVLVGDQSDEDTLHGWIKQAGTDFDVIVDDGGHTNLMIKKSFDLLWPTVKPGGRYVIEDLQVPHPFPILFV